MQKFLVYAPTYYGETDKVDSDVRPDYRDPLVPIVIHSCTGIRIVLGSQDYFDCDAADIQIERRSNGWLIFLHPNGGCDPSGFVFFLDDGRSFVVPENPICSTPLITMVQWDVAVAEVDKMKSPR